ncbi:hypothetical protein GGI25_002764 [Coemansia spiralis]|uniref:Uncharacterized protein n=1 Tax=Coemansia spiralis TaxID=417178 RepID=A0A9W8G825_9FUNG|nr:hypothetical protein GGI26_000737 [Coemansia sp. RSA 1358]KAJ2677974.1 hypothetical protein GGI25_002764 [Coemansia spiralis]
MSTLTLVENLPPVVTGHILFHLQKDGGDYTPLLHVNHTWRTAFLKAMCNRIEITQLWQEGRFTCQYTIGRNHVSPFSAANHTLVKQIRLEVELHSVLLGYALKSLNCKPFDAFNFPSAYSLELSIVICPCSQDIDIEKTNQNVADFVAYVEKMCPNVDTKKVSKRVYGSSTNQEILNIMDRVIGELHSKAETHYLVSGSTPLPSVQERSSDALRTVTAGAANASQTPKADGASTGIFGYFEPCTNNLSSINQKTSEAYLANIGVVAPSELKHVTINSKQPSGYINLLDGDDVTFKLVEIQASKRLLRMAGQWNKFKDCEFRTVKTVKIIRTNWCSLSSTDYQLLLDLLKPLTKHANALQIAKIPVKSWPVYEFKSSGCFDSIVSLDINCADNFADIITVLQCFPVLHTLNTEFKGSDGNRWPNADDKAVA